MEERNSEEVSLKNELTTCESVICDIESGKLSPSQCQELLSDCVRKLEDLTRRVSTMDLFSTNESVDELATQSVQYLMLPALLGFLVQQVNTDHRLSDLEAAKVYFRDFLERLSLYGIIGFFLPWKEDDADRETTSTRRTRLGDPASLRNEKIKRHKQQQMIEGNLKRLEAAHDKDDSQIRELMLIKLRLWSMKAVDQLEQIDREMQMLMQMRESRATGEPSTIAPVSNRLKPMILTRSEQQKRVFGLGYPSIPTVTVDEWFQGMVDSGKFGGHKKTESKKANEDDEQEKDDEKERAKLQQWDEYKDDHRRGWGNTKNKG